VGDSKLLSAGNRRALLAAAVGYLAPLPRTAELDDAFLAIPSEEWRPLAYVSAHERRKPPAARASYQGAERTVAFTLPGGAAGERCYQLRRLFIVSSEERAACRRNRARQRERAEAEIARVVARVGSRWYPTAARARAKIEAILEQRHLRRLYRVTCPGRKVKLFEYQRPSRPRHESAYAGASASTPCAGQPWLARPTSRVSGAR
jgi:hypothetical protein